MKVTLRQLRFLTSLAEEGHFGRAAAAVNVSQPALSVQIRDLETALGVRLVERGGRGGRGVVITPTGREVLRRAGRILDEVSEIEQVARWDRGLAGRLRLGVIPTVAPYLLPLALPRLRARNLALDLGVREAQTDRLLDEVRTGALDVAVVALPLAEAGLVATVLFEDRFLLAGSSGRLAGAGPALHPEDMEAGQLLLLDDGHCLTEQALAACAVDRSRVRTDLRAASLATLCRLVSEGFGMTLLPELAVRAECAAAPGLRLVRFASPEPRRTIGLVRRELSVDDGWFGELAAILGDAARTEIAQAG